MDAIFKSEHANKMIIYGYICVLLLSTHASEPYPKAA
jgi:hypothetical protein